MATSYINPNILISAGQLRIPYKLIPHPNSTAQEQQMELENICERATSQVDSYCNQILRSTFNLEQLVGPGFELSQISQTTYRAFVSNWPITSVLGGQFQVLGSNLWLSMQPSNFINESPPMQDNSFTNGGYGGDGVLVTGLPPYFSQKSILLQIAYVAGYAHTRCLETIQAGVSSFLVDDVTGWTGVKGQILDGSNSEWITVESVNATQNSWGYMTGEGTVNLSSPLQFTHAPNTILTNLPRNIELATLYLAGAEANAGGVYSISTPPTKGGMNSSSVPDMWTKLAHKILDPFKRII